MKKTVKLMLTISYVVLPFIFELWRLITAIEIEIEIKENGNGFFALYYIVPTVTLILCTITYCFVKLKFFPYYNMLLAIILLVIGENIVQDRYRLVIMREELNYVVIPLMVLVAWILMKSALFKKIYQWYIKDEQAEKTFTD